MTGWSPRSTRRLTRCRPIRPVPPVMNTRMANVPGLEDSTAVRWRRESVSVRYLGAPGARSSSGPCGESCGPDVARHGGSERPIRDASARKRLERPGWAWYWLGGQSEGRGRPLVRSGLERPSLSSPGRDPLPHLGACNTHEPQRPQIVRPASIPQLSDARPPWSWSTASPSSRKAGSPIGPTGRGISTSRSPRSSSTTANRCIVGSTKGARSPSITSPTGSRSTSTSSSSALPTTWSLRASAARSS